METEQGHFYEREIAVMTRKTEEDNGKANKNIKTKSKHSSDATLQKNHAS